MVPLCRHPFHRLSYFGNQLLGLISILQLSRVSLVSNISDGRWCACDLLRKCRKESFYYGANRWRCACSTVHRRCQEQGKLSCKCCFQSERIPTHLFIQFLFICASQCHIIFKLSMSSFADGGSSISLVDSTRFWINLERQSFSRKSFIEIVLQGCDPIVQCRPRCRTIHLRCLMTVQGNIISAIKALFLAETE